MQRDTVFVIVLVLIFIGVYVLTGLNFDSPPELREPENDSSSDVSVVVEDLDVPWGIEFLPEGDMLVTERPGTLLRIENETQSYEVEGVEHRGEGGLLGVTAHPNFSENNQIYLYMTTRERNTLNNRVVRYNLEEGQLTNSTVIIDDLPGAVYHDGGEIDFGPDGKLYVTAGDATNPERAQDTETRAGKILRLNPDGSIPEDNPFNNSVYSYGHRNPQGLAWVDGQLWATEHGDTQNDELNRIEPGENYGWPVIEADQSQEGMVQPEIYADGTTWAPSGAVYTESSIFFTGLRGNGLYQASLEDGEVVNLEKHLTDYGRLRAIEQGPEGDLYISTSNTDGRGSPAENDDIILRVDPERYS